MASSPLALPSAPETAAFRAVVKVLQSDPTLSRLVPRNSWRVWDGAAGACLEPTVATCPHLTIAPESGISEWETEDQHQADLLVKIGLSTAGTNVDDLFNFWHAVRRALFPPPGTERADWVRKTMQDARVTKPTLIKSGYGSASAVDADAPVMLVAAGVLKLVLLIDT